MTSIELPAAGEAAALDRLNEFLEETIYGYGAGRNLLDRAATSFLSPYLRFGALSIRQAYWGAKAAIDLAASKEAADRRGSVAERIDLARVLHGAAVSLPAHDRAAAARAVSPI